MADIITDDNFEAKVEAALASTRPIVAEQQGGDFWRIPRPVYHMPMPINADGNGPAAPEETVAVHHEVWDQLCRTLCSCRCEKDAILIANAVNAYSPTAAP